MPEVVKPATDGLQKGINQIYPVVNEVYQMMTGQDDIKAVDTNSLVAMGTRLRNLGKTELWLNTLARRIGMSINKYRPYKNKFASMARTQMQWGAIVQKITVDMPDAVLDKSWDVGMMDGQSIDQWIINNPKVHQVFFDKEVAYSYFTTIQTKYLNRAFTNAGDMAALISQIFGKVTNKREFTYEELGRLATANLIINLKPTQRIPLVTLFNNTSGQSLTPGQALYSADCIRFALSIMNEIADAFENMSTLYNRDGAERFSSKSDQRLFLLSAFKNRLQTVPEYLAFAHNSIVAKPTMTVPYWQASGTSVVPDWDTISKIIGTDENGSSVEMTNVIGLLHDYDVLGTFRHETDVYTTPVNARGVYYNTFWHENQFWFNMTDENAVVFLWE